MYLGIDIGTSGVKAVVIAADGELRAQASAPLSVSRPHPLWSEQDPDCWIKAAELAVMALPKQMRANVKAVGLAGQMHGAVLLGGDDRPLRPAILWNDGRSFVECDELETAMPDARAITGNIAMPGLTAPKLLWVKKHEPQIFDAVRTVLLPKDYLRLTLTGDKASDMSDSAGSLWLDVGRRQWSIKMLAACDLTEEHMPLLHEGNALTGRLSADVAVRWGMERVPVAAGGGDNAAAAVGIGVVNDGDAFLSLGTSGVIFVATKDFRPNPARAVHAFCHCLPDMWHQMAVHLSAASCVDWAAQLCGVDAPRIFDIAEQAGAGSGPELFLPYLSGERTPHNDPQVRGTLLGLDNESDAGRISAAVLEGVAFAHADGIDALRDAGTTIERLAVAGGGARSLHWGKILASVLNVRLEYYDGAEVGPAIGAAKLAHMALTGAGASEICISPPVRNVVEPDPALAERLSPKLARYRAAYAAIKSI